jgi:hypothetical protein
VSDDSVYIVSLNTLGGNRVRRIEFDGTSSSMVASFQPEESTYFDGFTLAPQNLAIVTCSNRITALDARTLEELYRFQSPPEASLHSQRCMADLTVVADEVFCCDYAARCLRVFSLAGEYLREIRGPWREPRYVTHCKGRLYVSEFTRWDEGEWATEYGPDGEELDDEEDWSAEKKAAGKRIFVVTPQGETLQVFDQFPTPFYEVASMAVARNRLVVCCLGLGEPSSPVYELKGV